MPLAIPLLIGTIGAVGGAVATKVLSPKPSDASGPRPTPTTATTSATTPTPPDASLAASQAQQAAQQASARTRRKAMGGGAGTVQLPQGNGTVGETNAAKSLIGY